MRTPGARTMAWLGLPAAALLAGGVGLAVASASPSHPARLASASAHSGARHAASTYRAAGVPGCATPVPVPSGADTPVPVPTEAKSPRSPRDFVIAVVAIGVVWGLLSLGMWLLRRARKARA